MEEKTKIKFIDKLGIWSNKFYSTWISMFTFIFILSLFGIIQILLFVFGGVEVSGFKFGDDKSWVSWVYLAISIPATVLGLVGYVYSIRLDNKFFAPTMISRIATIILSLAGGIMWTSIMIFIALFISVWKTIVMKKYGQKYNTHNNITVPLIIIFSMLFFIMGVLTIEIEPLRVIWWNKNAIGKNYQMYFDVFAATMTLIGILLMFIRSKYAFISFLITDCVYLFIFIFAKQWLSLLQTLMYIFGSLTAMFMWRYTQV